MTVTVYLIEFRRPIPGWINAHYCGATTNLDERIAAHRSGGTSKMFEIAKAWGIDFEVVNTWEFDDHDEGFRKVLAGGDAVEGHGLVLSVDKC